MSDPATPRRRKRSAAAGLSAAGAVAMLSACDPAPTDAELSSQRYGPPTEAAAFQSIAECVSSGDFTQEQCTVAQNEAFQNDAIAAPRFADQDTCTESFGTGNCRMRTENGQSFFVPLLTGFMIGRLLDGGGYRYHGLYRNGRDGSYYTGSGAWLYGGGYGGRPYRYQVGSRAVAAPITTQRIQTRSSVVSRGGFGGRASARSGGWGGRGG